MVRDIPTLSSGEKLLNQRFLAEKCMTEERATRIWKELEGKGRMKVPGAAASSSLQDSLIKCNAALEMARLEIVGIVFPHPVASCNSNSQGDNSQEEDEDEATPSMSQRSANSSSKRQTTKYLAMIYKHTPVADSTQKCASELCFAKSLGGPMAIKHRRAILEHLTVHTAAKRSTLINLKNELQQKKTNSKSSSSQNLNDDNDEGNEENNDRTTSLSSPNYTLAMAEHVVDDMLQDQWLIQVGSSSSGNGARRRTSMASQLALGPRSYMELSDMLTEQFGMDESKLPQQLFYR
ncbi:hypothetical protein ACA910_006206 [Epithemia clementina (nom. ined.)]